MNFDQGHKKNSFTSLTAHGTSEATLSSYLNTSTYFFFKDVVYNSFSNDV